MIIEHGRYLLLSSNSSVGRIVFIEILDREKISIVKPDLAVKPSRSLNLEHAGKESWVVVGEPTKEMSYASIASDAYTFASDNNLLSSLESYIRNSFGYFRLSSTPKCVLYHDPESCEGHLMIELDVSEKPEGLSAQRASFRKSLLTHFDGRSLYFIRFTLNPTSYES